MIYKQILSAIVKFDYNLLLANIVGYTIVAFMFPAWAVYKLKEKNSR